jgi:membrane associated rhomboid family serine protease
MLLPLHTDRRLASTPRVNLALIVVNAAMYLLQTWQPGVEAALLLRPYEPGLAGFVGSAFLHGGLLHLFGNLLFLYIFGNNINDTLGNAAYLGFYLGGCVFAAIMHSLLEDNPALGASGGVAAVMGAYLVLFPRSRIILLFLFFVITTVQVPAIWFIGIYFLLDFVQGLDSTLLGTDTGVARWAHVGGGLFGMAFGMACLKLGLVARRNDDALAMLERRRRRKELAATGQVHGSAMDVVPRSQADPKAQKAQDLRGLIREALDAGDTATAARQYAALTDVDPRQVLVRDDQMAVAQQLYRDQQHARAAAALSLYLDRHGRDRDGETAQARLMLGLLAARYLDKPQVARPHLEAAATALDELGDDEHAAFARDELRRLDGAET